MKKTPLLLALSLSSLSAQSIVVTTPMDESDGTADPLAGSGTSLREAIINSDPGTTITFDSTVFNGEPSDTIVLTIRELQIMTSLTIDASDIPNGVTIDGGSNGDFEITPNEFRCFNINDDRNDSVLNVTINNLIIQNGIASSGPVIVTNVGGNLYNRENLTLNNCQVLNGIATGGHGGGILNLNQLTLTNCTVSGNQTLGLRSGGAGIYSSGNSVSITNSTISNNLTLGIGSTQGAGIFLNVGDGETATLTNCTFTGNLHASNSNGVGSAILCDGGTTIIEHCTITENFGPFGMITSRGRPTTNVTIANSIVSNPPESSSSSSSDISLYQGSDDIMTFSGTNLIGSVGFGITEPILNTEPLLLSPLGDFGGPTQTIIPLPSSPAIDMATASTRSSDQRGLPNFASADIGSTEFQGESDLLLVWEVDSDGDGSPYGAEFALGTDPFVADTCNPANLAITFDATGQPVLDFGYNPDAVGTAVWILERSADLTQDSWIEIQRSTDPGDPSTISDLTAPTAARQFYRFRADIVE